MPDYHKYVLDARERVVSMLLGGIIAAAAMWFFTRSRELVAFAFLAAVFAGPLWIRRELCRRRQAKLREEFRSSLDLMLPLLRSGRSMEGVIEAVCEDMDPEEFRLLTGEYAAIRRGIQNRRPVEELFLDFAGRSAVSEIADFAEVLSISKRSRGNLTQILQHTAQILYEKLEAEEEVKTLLSGRKFEQLLLSLSPFLVLTMLMLMSPGYLDVLYTTIPGRMIMLGGLLLLGIGVWLSSRLSRIEL